MKNREQLPVGAKPAPGDLAFVQGFVNLLRYIQGQSESADIKILKTWLVRHDLITASVPLGRADLKTALSLHDALRGLLRANNGADPGKKTVRLLNKLVSLFKLTVVFQENGTAILQPAGRGVEKALGILLSIVVGAMAEGTWSRLKICANDKCQWVFYDSSKNHSGRWCDMSVCGARIKARTYRKRRAGSGR